MRPQASETTPNYFGVGPGLSVGFSIGQAFDIAAFGVYMPGTYGAAKLGQEETRLTLSGVHLGLRLQETVLLGIRFGKAQYRLTKPSGAEGELREPGDGTLGGFVLGTIFPIDRNRFWELSLEIKQLALAAADATTAGTRIFDSLRMCVTYTFNGYRRRQADDGMFRNVF